MKHDPDQAEESPRTSAVGTNMVGTTRETQETSDRRGSPGNERQHPISINFQTIAAQPEQTFQKQTVYDNNIKMDGQTETEEQTADRPAATQNSEKEGVQKTERNVISKESSHKRYGAYILF